MSPRPDALLLADVLDKPLGKTVDTLDKMLVDFNEVQNTLNSGLGGGSEGNWGFQMPATYTRSYRRLHELLKGLRQNGRNEPLVGELTRTVYWHVAEFYLRARRVQRPKMRVIPSGKHQGRTLEVLVDGKPQFEVVAIRHCDMRTDRVLDGLCWLERAWPASCPEQPDYLTPERWEQLLNPPKVLVA